VHKDDDSSEYVPGGQSPDMLVSPVVLQYLPGLQGVHDDELADPENVPAGHKVQVDAPALENEPAGQAPLPLEVDEPAGQNQPASHSPLPREVDEPEGQNLPALQSPFPWGAVWPERQK
jgi:hypothetical protein